MAERWTKQIFDPCKEDKHKDCAAEWHDSLTGRDFWCTCPCHDKPADKRKRKTGTVIDDRRTRHVNP